MTSIENPTIYTAHDVPDLLNSLPTLFGFTPTESFVGIATSGERRRFGFRLRVDIPPAEHVEALAEMVAAHLVNQGAEGAILIAVTERQELAATLLEAVEQQLSGVQIIVSARAHDGRYWAVEPGFPAEGVAYTPDPHHLSVVQAIAAGQAILPDREALVARYRAVEGPRREWLEQAAWTVFDQLLPVLGRVGRDGTADAGMAVVGPIIDRALAGQLLSDDDLLRFAVWVSGISVRDEVWARITRENAPEMLDLLVQVARSVVPPFEPAVLSLAAFAAWLSGDGAQALIALDRALEADPSYSMATLMMDMVERAVPPSTWEGFTAV